MENQIPLNQVSIQKQKKSYEEMETCKNQNSSCQAISSTEYLTGAQSGSIGSGEHKAPALKCVICDSKEICSKKLALNRLGWC